MVGADQRVAQFIQRGRFDAILDTGRGGGDFAGDKVQTATRAFVVKENTSASKQTIRLTVAAGHHVGVGFGDAVGVVGVDWGGLGGDAGNIAINLPAGCLVDAGVGGIEAHCFQHPHRAQCGHFASVVGVRPTVRRHRLGSNVIDFVGLIVAQEAGDALAVE